MNAKWLQSQLLAEDERNKIDKPSVSHTTLHKIYLSRAGTYDTITFSGGVSDEWPELFQAGMHDSRLDTDRKVRLLYL